MLAAFAFQLRAILLFRRMRLEVNARVPEDARIPAVGLSLLRGRVIRLHRQLFPSSRLRRDLYAWWFAEIAMFVSALACVLRFVTH